MTYTYSKEALKKDYIRGAIGGVLTFLPLIYSTLFSTSFYVFFSLFALFFIFTIQTYVKSISTFRIEENVIYVKRLKNFQFFLNDLRYSKLKYFVLQKEKKWSPEEGWMQLIIKDKEKTLKIDSSLDGFEKIVEKVADQIEKNNIKIGESTRQNFEALGYVLE